MGNSTTNNHNCLSMKAKEYLEVHKTTIPYFNEISRLIDVLYGIRHDKEATEVFYHKVLAPDIRFSQWREEHKEWQPLHQQYGASHLEPVYVTYEDQIDKEDAPDIRHELLKVVREDSSFGYLISLLDKDADAPVQLQIEQAIREDLTTLLKSAQEKISSLENQLSNTTPVSADEKQPSRVQGSMKVSTEVLLAILKKLNINTVNTNATTIADLISYLTGYSHNTIRDWVSPSNRGQITPKANKLEVERINQILNKLNLDITIKCKETP